MSSDVNEDAIRQAQPSTVVPPKARTKADIEREIAESRKDFYYERNQEGPKKYEFKRDNELDALLKRKQKVAEVEVDISRIQQKPEASSPTLPTNAPIRSARAPARQQPTVVAPSIPAAPATQPERPRWTPTRAVKKEEEAPKPVEEEHDFMSRLLRSRTSIAPTASPKPVTPVRIAEQKSNPKPEVVVEPEPEPEVVAEPEPEVIAEPEVVVEPEPEVVAEPDPEPEVIAEPETEVIVEPEPEVVAEPDPEPEVVAEPEPEVVADPQPEPEVVVDPEPELYNSAVMGGEVELGVRISSINPHLCLGSLCSLRLYCLW